MASLPINGTDNLIVEVATSSGTANTPLRTAAITGRRVAVNDTTGTAADGAVDDIAYHIALRFNGATMDINTQGGGVGDGFSDGKRQYLYLASELGTKGTITKIACRSAYNAAVNTGFLYDMVLSHTAATTLGGNFAANLTNPMPVFSGALGTPAVLIGDWIEIPLSTPFAYNGKDNLVVQIAGTGGAGGVGCRVNFGYVARRVFASSSTATLGTVSDYLLDMRFTLQ